MVMLLHLTGWASAVSDLVFSYLEIDLYHKTQFCWSKLRRWTNPHVSYLCSSPLLLNYLFAVCLCCCINLSFKKGGQFREEGCQVEMADGTRLAFVTGLLLCCGGYTACFIADAPVGQREHEFCPCALYSSSIHVASAAAWGGSNGQALFTHLHKHPDDCQGRAWVVGEETWRYSEINHQIMRPIQ